MSALLFVDCETTGLEDDDEIWEIGVIARTPGQEDVAHVYQIFGFTQEHFRDPKAAEIGGFAERYATATMLHITEAAHVVASLSAGRHLVGANPAFDAGFLKRLLAPFRIAPPWHHRLIDVQALAMGHAGWALPLSLKDTAEQLGLFVEHGRLHSALYDADLAKRIYDLVIHGKGDRR